MFVGMDGEDGLEGEMVVEEEGGNMLARWKARGGVGREVW